MRLIIWFVLGFAAFWAGFALGWMANGWRTGERVRQAARSMRYQLATKEEEFQHMRDALERTRSEVLQLRAQVADTDDLTRIAGISSGTARELNRLGYQSYRDVAAWTEDDLERLAEELRAFPSGAGGRRWIEQARSLHREKYGEEP